MTKLRGKVWIDSDSGIKFMRAEVEVGQYAHVHLLTELYHINLDTILRELHYMIPGLELIEINGLNGFVPTSVIVAYISATVPPRDFLQNKAAKSISEKFRV